MTRTQDGLSSEDRRQLIDVWKVSEDVAMHFNSLLLGFRLKAISGIAVGAVVGFGLKFSDLTNPSVAPVVFVALAVIWFLVWAADFLYYYRLLAGAVDELLRLEKALGNIHLSHLIERRVQGGGRPERGIESLVPCDAKYPAKYPSWPIWVFYTVPALVLLSLAILFGIAAWYSRP